MNEQILEKALQYQGYGTEVTTALHPIVAIAILLAGLMMFLIRRQYVLVPFLFLGIFVPVSQRIVIANLNLYILRIVILLGFVRLIMGSELRSIKINRIDKTLILWGVCSVITYTLLRMDFGAFINRIGFVINTLGIYFVFRSFLRDLDDIDRIIRLLVIISVILAFFMIIEQFTGRNLFSILGLPQFTAIRSGRLRSQGSFLHAISAGIFGAALMPLFVSLWWADRRSKKLAIIGVVSATLITLMSASSGPVLAYLAGIGGLFMWRFRRHMRKIRWGIFISLITLHMIMKAPVWALLGRVSIVSGSTGYHRYKLLDSFINHFSDWWFLGTEFTYDWGWQMFDTVIQYVSEGIHGGFLRLALFIMIIVLSFRGVGLMIKRVENKSLQLRFWAFGSSLFVHVVGFFGISYFDQINMIWYFLLALISVQSNLYQEILSPGTEKVGQDFKMQYSSIN